MPEIVVGSQIFDVVFHPTHSIVYTGLLTGHVKAHSIDEQGNSDELFNVRPSKRSCRGLSINSDGSRLYAVGKGASLNTIDTATSQIETRTKVHDSPINRVKWLTPWLLTTGDDEGVIKLWDPRGRECVKKFTQHFDYISDFLWLEDKKQLLATSADGTLSIMDVRSKKAGPYAQSEDQEDELLSVVAIKSAAKIVVGTQLGVLSIFNRSSGWSDCVDRIPGHPHSVDALHALPSSVSAYLPSDVDPTSTILTGSSDGFVRAVKLFPTKLLGVIVDHGEMPVERIAISGAVEYRVSLGEKDEEENNNEKGKAFAKKRGGQLQTTNSRPKSNSGSDDDSEGSDEDNQPSGTANGRWWVGSAGHEDVLHLTGLVAAFHVGDSDDDRQDKDVREEGDGNGSEIGGDPGSEEGETDRKESRQDEDIDNEGQDDRKKMKVEAPTSELHPIAEGVDVGPATAKALTTVVVVASIDVGEKARANSDHGRLVGEADSLDNDEGNRGHEGDSDSDTPKLKKKRKREQDPLAAKKKKKGRNEVDMEDMGFFNGL